MNLALSVSVTHGSTALPRVEKRRMAWLSQTRGGGRGTLPTRSHGNNSKEPGAVEDRILPLAFLVVRGAGVRAVVV